MIVEYDGTEYVGWQTQMNGIAVQEVIEHALEKVTGERIILHGSGRTDSGVHARAQVSHFDTDARMSADKFAFALNTMLPNDIRILYSEETNKEFHARFSAKKKEYCYTLQPGPHARVFTSRTALHVHLHPDIDRMNLAASYVLGKHDFAAFMSAGSKLSTTVRTIYRSEWVQENGLIRYYVSGNGFLYNMIRILVGTMLLVGSGRLEPETVKHALSTKNRTDAGDTAPAHGLCLYRVIYDDFDTEKILQRL